MMGVLTPLPPGLFLAIVLGTLYGALAHLVAGRHWLRLPLFLLAGIGGCVVVWLTRLRVLTALPAPGGLAIVEASVVAWLLLSLIAALRRA
jgi:hypothetical protein